MTDMDVDAGTAGGDPPAATVGPLLQRLREAEAASEAAEGGVQGGVQAVRERLVALGPASLRGAAELCWACGLPRPPPPDGSEASTSAPPPGGRLEVRLRAIPAAGLRRREGAGADPESAATLTQVAALRAALRGALAPPPGQPLLGWLAAFLADRLSDLGPPPGGAPAPSAVQVALDVACTAPAATGPLGAVVFEFLALQRGGAVVSGACRGS